MKSIDERIIKCLNHIGVIVGSNDKLDELQDFIDDSVTFITLIVELEQEFSIEIPDEYLLIEKLVSFERIRDMVNELIKADEILSTEKAYPNEKQDKNGETIAKLPGKTTSQKRRDKMRKNKKRKNKK